MRLPIAGASLVVEHRLGHMGSAVVAPEFWSAGLIVVAHGLSCSEACGNLPGSGIEPMSPTLAGRFLTTEPLGKPSIRFLNVSGPQKIIDLI